MGTFRCGAMNDGHHVRLAGWAAYEGRISADWNAIQCGRVYDNCSRLRVGHYGIRIRVRLRACRRIRLIHLARRLRTRCLRLELHTQLRLQRVRRRIQFPIHAYVHGRDSRPTRTVRLAAKQSTSFVEPACR